MTQTSDRIESLVSEKRVKKHVFDPSKREIWTVVGKGKEHWLDPEAEYCSCPGFYFGNISSKKSCYHLESAKLAIQKNMYETVEFSDEEYSDFISSLLSDL